ncbi:MAG: hypothetical protein AKCLJLPJ_01556 [Fimbriimonadales bacterium]|nr:MAG: Hsp20/alpha crystallin family protein [Armatimonadota bacterium]MBV6503484.1 hypothetical protein [Fimbriimonadales bacterium]MCE7900197.1 Hsp20/alpha crystallin family protein [Armatimonadetes bacterium ATM1]MDL1928845.1 Hsp20/alpha crystallin family protein [Fimbriimonadia bacterium ATM]MBC6970723.1 Hsp20/alpha crystallin family protein [Armatimonadota bacterium]
MTILLRMQNEQKTNPMKIGGTKVITRYSPLDRFRTFDQLSKLMNEVWGDADELRKGWSPPVDVKETDREITFIAELPGMDQKDIEVELVGDMLTIRGKREFAQEESRENYVRIERSYGSFQRSFSLSVPVKADAITAEYKNGVLSVVLPKADEVQPRKIQIAAQNGSNN